QWLKKHYPEIKILMGGGFANTELRSLSDERVFEFFDFVSLDDGELPLELIIENIESGSNTEFKRTFLLENDKVLYKNNSPRHDYKQAQVGTPDYSDLLLDQYISVIEIVNPMHRMWSDGRWNKLTMAHGCYWGKCTFCDISLDYIKVYEPIAAGILCDRMEEMIAQTGETGFHFVDEAAPPALMRELALEILRRKLAVTWWTNIRFEKSFTKDLCLLLKASGCIAVSGGLEVASDRLLQLIDKGVTVEQVAKVTRNFTEAGVMVHAYLMYGYPTQTVQETVDSLEMVRQLFEAGVLQSGFWHQFAMTAHSPVGMYPEKFGVVKDSDTIGTFANNDLTYTDTTGIDHDQFSFGLKKSLFNFMHGICLDYDLQDWFDFTIPKTTIRPDFIYEALEEETNFSVKPNAKVIWLGGKPTVESFTKTKNGSSWNRMRLTFYDKKETFEIQLSQKEGEWLVTVLDLISYSNLKTKQFQELKADFENELEDFELFWFSKPITTLKEFGLLVL
ncbi:MAG TPA: radical SAM protein, partial [Flavobacterium sp.]|nr:radical SAM protein [Flavobacterium sp.]